MKRLFFILFILFVSNASAQERIEYGNFIQTDTAIRWSAICNYFVNLTPVNPNFDIRNFYFNKLKRNSVVSYKADTITFSVIPVATNYMDFIRCFKKESFDITKINWTNNYEVNDISEDLFNKDSNSCDTCLLSNKFSFFKVKQLLFYKNHKIQIRNILLSPLIYMKNAGEVKDETTWLESEAFAFNSSNYADEKIPENAVFISTTVNWISLLPNRKNADESNILTLKNWRLYSILKEDIQKRYIKIADSYEMTKKGNRKLLDPLGLDMYGNPEIEIPQYDSSGNQIGILKKRNEINPDSMFRYTLIQDFYFDFKNEKLYSKLIKFSPQQSVITPQGINLGYTEYWTFIFPDEKKSIVKKTK